MPRLSRRSLILGSTGLTAAAAGLGLYSLSGPGGALVPGVPRARPVEGDSQVPQSTDVVVIGGGFIGCATALTLAERGVAVALCEKGVVAGEASGRSLGWIDTAFLDPIKFELIHRSKQLWADMDRRVEGQTGYRPCGLLGLCASQKEWDAAEAWVASTRGLPGATGRMLAGKELNRLVPASRIPWSGALYNPTDAAAEPVLAAPAMAAAARRKGAIILQQCAVRGLEMSGGRVSAVVTEKGTIRAPAVVLAGGVWSPVFARSLGLELPQFEAFASMMSVAPMAGPDISVWGNGVSWRRQPDGGYCLCAVNAVAPITPTTLRYLPRLMPALRALWDELDPVFSPRTFWREWRMPASWPLDRPSPFEALRILQPEVRHARLQQVLATTADTFPAFAGARVREKWAGALVSTPDNMPVISTVAAVPELYLGTGFYYGLTMGPAAGEALADLVTGSKPAIDLRPYRYERLVDGSTLTFRS